MLLSYLTSIFNNQIFCIVLWIAVFLIALCIELSTSQLVSIWFCGGALVSLILAIFSVPLLYQIIVWVVVSGLLLLLSKLVFKKKLDVATTKTNADSMIGERILITKEVSKETMGEGKIRDVVWSIIVDDDIIIKEGEFALVKDIRGNKLVVSRKE